MRGFRYLRLLRSIRLNLPVCFLLSSSELKLMWGLGISGYSGSFVSTFLRVSSSECKLLWVLGISGYSVPFVSPFQSFFISSSECKPTGCFLSVCLEESFVVHQLAFIITEEAAAVCGQPMSRGYCRALYHKWAWSQAARACVEFVYGGCGGNDNSFDSEEMCLQVCSGAI